MRGGDLNAWVNPTDPTLGRHPDDKWNLIKQVVDLKAPATYRFRVSFRWIGAHGRVLGTATRNGPSCYQPELRPDLQVRTISVKAVPGRPDVNAYVALIRNAGATAAGPFEVQFSDGGVLKTHTVSRLASARLDQGAVHRPALHRRHRRLSQRTRSTRSTTSTAPTTR